MSDLVRATIQLALETFLGSRNHSLRYYIAGSLDIAACLHSTDLPIEPLFCLSPNPIRGRDILLRHSIICIAGTGISTCYPSTTPVGLALGPDYPRADEPSPGDLGQSVCRILTCISLLTPAFSLPYCPHVLALMLQPVWNAPLPNNNVAIVSVYCLAPVNFRRRITRLVSCYALFEGWLLLSQPPSCLCNPTSFST